MYMNKASKNSKFLGSNGRILQTVDLYNGFFIAINPDSVSWINVVLKSTYLVSNTVYTKDSRTLTDIDLTNYYFNTFMWNKDGTGTAYATIFSTTYIIKKYLLIDNKHLLLQVVTLI